MTSEEVLNGNTDAQDWSHELRPARDVLSFVVNAAHLAAMWDRPFRSVIWRWSCSKPGPLVVSGWEIEWRI